MTATITALDVARKALELADADPEFVYQPEGSDAPTTTGCKYVHRDADGKPTGEGCIFGQALTGLGVNPDDIREFISVDEVMHRLGIESTDPKLEDYMQLTQANQDGGDPWGLSIATLREYVTGDVA